MRLMLRNGYPMPFPKEATEAEQEKISSEAAGIYMRIDGVVNFEWLHTITIEFKTPHDMVQAVARTGWTVWDAHKCVLEAPNSPEDGYDHPAIVVPNRKQAFCGFQLLEDE